MLDNYKQYAVFLSTLRAKFSSIQNGKFKAYLTSASEGHAEGTIKFPNEVILTFVEEIDFVANKLFKYGYTVHQAGKKLYYYDSQPHPDHPALASTHPHHKHIHPDIKHHRIPAPGFSFDHSNLEFLIREIEATLL